MPHIGIMAAGIHSAFKTFSYKISAATSYIRISNSPILPARLFVHNAVIATPNKHKEMNMNTRQLQQSANRTFLNSAELNNFKPQRLTTKALSDDSCWDEFDADYEDAIPGNELSFLDDISCN